jgi:hypothetical protein
LFEPIPARSVAGEAAFAMLCPTSAAVKKRAGVQVRRVAAWCGIRQ